MKLSNGDEIEVIREVTKTRIRVREPHGKASAVLTPAELEEHITACAMERFRADPESYERFIAGLLPHRTIGPVEVTFRDVSADCRVPFSMRFDSEGRTTITGIDVIEIDDNSGTKQ